MRIISGKYGGRIIKAPAGHRTHPMSEKIRGAIFNALGDIEGLTMLDAFSGSGAISIEAVSKGVSSVDAIDSSKNAYETIIQNIKSLGIKNIKVSQANVSSWLDNNSNNVYDLIVCDPPYDNVDLKLLHKIEKHLAPNGVLVLSLPPNILYKSVYELLLEKDYNDAKLYFYKKFDSTEIN